MVHGSLAALAKVLRQTGPRLPRKKAVELTDAAAERIRMLLDKRHKVGGQGWAWQCASLAVGWQGVLLPGWGCSALQRLGVAWGSLGGGTPRGGCNLPRPEELQRTHFARME